MSIRLIGGDCREVLATLPADSVHCVVTSPPYYGLRDYGTAQWAGGDAACDHVAKQPKRGNPTYNNGQTSKGYESTLQAWGDRDVSTVYRDTCGKCGATRVDRQIGLEASPDLYLAEMVRVFREVKRVLRPDGTCWVNLGDSFVNKQLQMMPARVALAMQADGWFLRSDIIWCLSGGTRVYARTRKGEMPMTIKDMVRLDPATVQLWNGEKWTQVLGWNETPRPDRTYEIELRNGQRIGCTGGHLWPTLHGNIRADALNVGDTIRTCRLPQPDVPKRPAALDDQMVGWLVGLYIAEGSQSEGTIQIASHLNEDVRFESLRRIADAFHATAAIHKTSENGCTINLNGPVLNGIISAYVSGRIASDKHLHPRCWQRSDEFLSAVLAGYLSGDGHWDASNERWRLGFCANDELVADLRTIGARVGASVRLKRVVHKIADAEFPGYKGEIRFARSTHRNSRDDGEIVAIRESRARKFWDIGVADEPHLFALASGVLTHNSKPNPMPESVTDRPTSAHEHVFLLAKAARYYYDADAVRETSITNDPRRPYTSMGAKQLDGRETWYSGEKRDGGDFSSRSLRNVWTIATAPYSAAHFATFPPALAERCIRAGTSERGCCAACGAPWRRVTQGEFVPTQNPVNVKAGDKGLAAPGWNVPRGRNESTTTGWSPSCACNADVVPCRVLDCFAGAGTTLLVADRLQRDAIGIELSPDYTRMAMDRCRDDAPLFAEPSPPPAEPLDLEEPRIRDLFA